MRLGRFLLSTALIALAVAPAAAADKPMREINPSQEDGVITDQCAFPVLGHIDGPEINTLFLDRDGNPVKQIVVFPGNKLTVTNLETGTSVTVLATGSFQRRGNPDGSEADKITGHGIFFPNPITGEPGIWDMKGHASATFDPAGTMTSGDLSGNLVDLCDQLAA